MAKLFSLAPMLKEKGINVILVQIDEAHSDAWPVAIDAIFGVPQPLPQACFKDRLDRAKHFIETYHPPYPVYVDGWDNHFANLFRAWPDKYHCVDINNTIIAKSEYGTDGDKEAKIVEDCTVLLETLANNL